MRNHNSSKSVRTFAMSIGIAVTALVGSAPHLQAQTAAPGMTTSPNAQFQIAQSALSEMEQAIFNQINDYRASKGLKPMVWNNEVAKQAREHSLNMAKKIVPFGHQGIEKRAKALSDSVRSTGTGENVGWVMSRNNPHGKVIEAWIKSQKHRDNIEGNFSMTGIGISVSSSGEYYFTQDFVRQ